MEYFTSRNLVLLALGQILVLVGAILGAAAAHKWFVTFRMVGEPALASFLLSYGWLGLILPVAWIALVLHVFGNRDSSDEARIGTVMLGLLLLVLFLGVAWFGAAWPLLRMTSLFN